MDISAETVSFWLDNKMSSGVKVAAAGDLNLVLYRERYYVVADGAAQTKAGKTVRYSKSSLPALWRKALRGEAVTPPPDKATEELQTMPIQTRLTRKAQNTPKPPATVEQPSPPEAPVVVSKTKKARKSGKSEVKPALQSFVTASCPYCEHKHELPVDKGKNGKPFFSVCSRCNGEFGVRFVQVLQYVAQTAGF